MPKLDYTINVQQVDGTTTDLTAFEGKALLIVNTATRCGLTPQLEGLESLQSSYAERGFTVLGFPSNEFGGQSPEGNQEIAEFCTLRYGTQFPTFAKVTVNGSEAHPLFQQLRTAATGILGNRIKWNFTKFLVAPDGEIVRRYAPTTEPGALAADIEKVLP